MAPCLLHLPNGQVIVVKPIFGGLRFEPQDLNIHKSPFPPGWIIILSTEGGPADGDDVPHPDNDNAAKHSNLGNRYRRPTLNKDSIFISSISNPSSSDFKVPVSQSRQIAMMLWASLYWYFHQPQPEPQLPGTNSATPRAGRPKGDWTIRVKREGIFKSRHMLSKLERMGLVWSTDTSVGTDIDDRGGEGFVDLFVSQRSFWQIDARLFLFTLSPNPQSPFIGSPHSSRPNSPSRLEHTREIGLQQTPLSPSPRPKPLELQQHHQQHDSGQNFGLWAPPTPGPFQSASHLPTFYPAPPAHFTITNGVRHPVRPKPPRPGEIFYTRYIPSQKQYLSFRAACPSSKGVPYRGPLGHSEAVTRAAAVAAGATTGPDAQPLPSPSQSSYSELSLVPCDVDLLHSWMNDPRVAAAWGESGPREHQEKFLLAGLRSQHSFPVIGCWDGRPFGYFELYWTREDTLARHAPDAGGSWDRGIHLLVGEQEFRGRHRFRIWVSALVHYLWLADPRTEAVYLEPRVDNEKIITYLQDVGFHKEREIALPHKQSALMKITREAWEAPFL